MKMSRYAVTFAFGINGLLIAVPASAADCVEPENGRTLFGAGTAAFTAEAAELGSYEASLPEGEGIALYYNDAGPCPGYADLTAPDGVRSFKFWNAEGKQSTCEAPASRIDFAITQLTPATCAGLPTPLVEVGSVPLSIDGVAIVTHADSTENVISAEALHFLYRFGAEHETYQVAPWTSAASLLLSESTFQKQLLGAAFQLGHDDFQGTVPINGIVTGLWAANPPSSALGFTSFAAAAGGTDSGQLKTLAYQHFGQSGGYLPDSSRERADAWNVRSGQYPLATPRWVHTKTDDNERTELVQEFVRALRAHDDSPRARAALEATIYGGTIPLCATHALREGGDFSPLVSYAHENPCHGYYEELVTGTTALPACDEESPCEEGTCRFGFCEAY